MGDMIVKDNLNGLTENATMGSSFGVFNSPRTEQDSEIGEGISGQSDQFKCHHVNKPCHETIFGPTKYTFFGPKLNQFEVPKHALEPLNGCLADAGTSEKAKEVQTSWLELSKCFRYVYKDAITSLPGVVIKESIPSQLQETLTHLIQKLFVEDSQQLFIRLEVLVRDFILEAKDYLKDIQNSREDVSVLYLKGLLACYGTFCAAAESLTPYLTKLDALLMKRFSVNFVLLNKYLFQTCLYADAIVQNNVPLYISQLRSPNPETEYSNQELVHSYLAFDDEMTDVASKWLDVKKMILRFSKKRALSNSKQPLLLEDWEVYREHRELAASRGWQTRTAKRDLAEFDVQLLSLLDDITSRMPELEINSGMKTGFSTCKSCNADILCSCDDCTIKHILTCGLETPPASPAPSLNGPCLAQDKVDEFNHAQLLKQFGITSKLNTTSDVSESVPNSTRHLPGAQTQNSGTSLIQPALPNSSSHPSCIFPVTPGHYATHAKNPNQINKASKIPMPKNFLKLITDKVITKTFVKTSEQEVIETANDPVKTTVPSAPSSTAPATSNAVPEQPATSINTPNPPQATSKPEPNVKPPIRQSNEGAKPTPPVQENAETKCKHLHRVPIKPKKETSPSPIQVCKDGCQEHGPVKTAKESRRCDCPHCEVFESTSAQVAGKLNKTRDRLRTRLNEKRTKALKDKNTETTEQPTVSKLIIMDKEKENEPSKTDQDTRDIRDLVNFIEGTDRNAKLLNAQKRAAKKARRRERKLEEERLKEEERLRLEAERLLEEERRLAEQRRIEEEARLIEKARLKELANRKKKGKKSKRGKDKGGQGNRKNLPSPPYLQPNPTNDQPIKVGPMVTIKRVMESSSIEPTVTITLKGSTPAEDQLLYTLINGQADQSGNPCDSPKPEALTKKQRKRLKKVFEKIPEPLPPAPVMALTKKERKKKKKEAQKLASEKIKSEVVKKEFPKNVIQKELVVPKSTQKTTKPDSDLNLEMLRLPPGITITKVDGPPVHRKIQQNTRANTPVNRVNTPPPPMQQSHNRNGVIVVDTVKLKKELPITDLIVPSKPRKNKKKKNKGKKENQKANSPQKMQQDNSYSYNVSAEVLSNNDTTNCNPIVTIKNPMFFNQYQESLKPNTIIKENPLGPIGSRKPSINGLMNHQASIIKGANGMVTIRSPRINGSGHYNGHGDPRAVGGPLLSELKPVMGPNTSVPVYKPIHNDSKLFDAQEILSGLPGIEITKINKDTARTKNDCKKVFQPADVSIIPTNVGNGNHENVYKLFNDHNDWSLESVFAPKDIKEDEVLDAEELELEAFKRFCQQSVPPERKEKVAHLNVKDIVFKNKAANNAWRYDS